MNAYDSIARRAGPPTEAAFGGVTPHAQRARPRRSIRHARSSSSLRVESPLLQGFDDPSIGCREGVSPELRTTHPSDLLTSERAGRALKRPTLEDVHRDPKMRIGVPNRHELASDADAQSNLLFDLSRAATA